MIKSLLNILLLLGIFVLLFTACTTSGEEETETSNYNIAFGRPVYQVLVDGNVQLKIMKVTTLAVKPDTIWYDTAVNKDGLVWTVSDNNIVSVDQKGIVTSKKIGSTKVSVQSQDKKLSASVTVSVLKGYSIKPLGSQLDENTIFSKGIYLVRNSVMQSFDINSKGTIFYNQLGGSLPQYIYVIRGEANKPHTDFMQLKYFGHGTNIAVEEEGNDHFIWIASNGTKGSDGEYGSSQTISRFEYIPGAIMENYTEETYYLKNKYNVHPALDKKNDVLAITTSGGGDPKRYFYFYKLSEAKALPYTSVTLTPIKFGGEESGTSEQTVTRTIQVKDLGKLTPINSFSVETGQTKEYFNSYDFQGFDIADGYVYFYEGAGNDNTGTLASNAYVTVLDMSGNVIYGRTNVKAISSITELYNLWITATGYMEAEGIKMKNGTLYLGFASKSTDNLRRANIFKYSIK